MNTRLNAKHAVYRDFPLPTLKEILLMQEQEANVRHSEDASAEDLSKKIQLQAFTLLETFKTQSLEPSLEQYFDKKDQELGAFLPDEGMELLENLRDFVMRSGKRLRSALVYYIYIGLGGKNREAATQVAQAMELVHSFLLIHDDIIDQDQLRRNKPSMHTMYKKIYAKRFAKHIHLEASKEQRQHDAAHFGESIGIVGGDILWTFAHDILSEADIDPVRLVGIFNLLNKAITNVGFGEMIEVYEDLRGNLSQDEIIRIYDLKTAQYTLECPLLVGATLAGASKDIQDHLRTFSFYLGIAFQVQDDLIGMFGTQEEIGKPVGSDIREGKETLLINYATKQATKIQQKTLKKILGNPDTTASQIKQVKEILIDTGARDACISHMVMCKTKALNAIAHVPLSSETRTFLHGMAEYIVSRSS